MFLRQLPDRKLHACWHSWPVWVDFKHKCSTFTPSIYYDWTCPTFLPDEMWIHFNSSGSMPDHPLYTLPFPPSKEILSRKQMFSDETCILWNCSEALLPTFPTSVWIHTILEVHSIPPLGQLTVPPFKELLSDKEGGGGRLKWILWNCS